MAKVHIAQYFLQTIRNSSIYQIYVENVIILTESFVANIIFDGMLCC